MKGLLILLLCGCAWGQDFDANLHRTAPNPESATRTEANAALDARDYSKAVRLLVPLAAAHPEDAHLLYDLGSAQDALDQASPAETSYRAAVAADPKLLEAHLALGLLEARGGHLEAARAELVLATETDDGDKLLRARAYRTLARIDETTRPAAARDELLAALQLSPETPEDTLLTAELAEHATGGTAAAETAYRRVLAQKPGDPEATAALAHLLGSEKKNDQAEALLREALGQAPGDVVLTSQLAALLATEGKKAEALPLVETVHQAHPENADVTHLLASLYAQTGDFKAAEPLYAALLQRASGDVGLMVAEGDALVHLDRYAEAEAVLGKAVARPAAFAVPADLGDAAGRLAFACSENNDPAGALRALAVRGTVLPPTATTLFLGAISEDKLHHTKAATEAYKAFLAAANGTLPDQVFEAQHRLVALEHMK